MRFDDSLKTVLSADMATGFGAQSAWRQLVDLMSRGRIAADEPTIARLRLLRQAVPLEIRAATARALAFATPGAALVGLFAEDVLTVSAPVLRTAVLSATDWLAILPRLSPPGRSILRHRRDLPGDVLRGLESFGATDFVLGDGSPAMAASAGDAVPAVLPPPAPDTPLSETPFVSLGDVARGLPVVAEALRQAEPASVSGGFPIADLVARIDAFNRAREARPRPASRPSDPALHDPALHDPALHDPALHDSALHDSAPHEDRTQRTPPTSFRYETDRDGVIRWVEGVARGALVGASLAYPARQGAVSLDAVMSGALRQRSRFADARLDVDGISDAAGCWRVSGDPVFDHATGRFAGFCGTARRARADEGALRAAVRSDDADALRQLVHELRTPTNAIAGFAELMEAELLGPIAPVYRDHATAIRLQAASLIAAIDDLDTAARIEGRALEARPTVVPLRLLLAGIVHDLAPLAASRGAVIAVDDCSDASARIDDRLAARLFSRLLGALVAAAGVGERIAVSLVAADADLLTFALTRPAAFAGRDEETLLRIDADAGQEGEGAPLLGTGFALRLARNLAAEVGGSLTFASDRLTLCLPAAVDEGVEQATN